MNERASATVRIELPDVTVGWLGARARHFEVETEIWARLCNVSPQDRLPWIYLGLWVLPDSVWDGLEQILYRNWQLLQKDLLCPQTQQALEELGTSLLHLQRHFGATLYVRNGRDGREDGCWGRWQSGVKERLAQWLAEPVMGEEGALLLAAEQEGVLARSLREALAQSEWLDRVIVQQLLAANRQALQEPEVLQSAVKELARRGLVTYQEDAFLKVKLIGARRVPTLQLGPIL